MSNKQYMYMVNYSRGIWDGYVLINVFVTHDETKAQAYVDKFNTLLDKWQTYFRETVDIDNAWLMAHVDEKVKRAYELLEVNEAYIEKIEIR